MASDLEVRQAQSQVEAARVDIARYSGQMALDENALNLLVGSPVAAMLADTLDASLRRSRPDCRPMCCSAGPTFLRPSTS